jgi:hypothetical protein
MSLGPAVHGQIFDLETGNKTIKSIGDPNPADDCSYTIDVRCARVRSIWKCEGM